MPAHVWVGLAVLLLALAGGVAFVVTRGLATWRSFKRLGAEIDGATAPLLESVARAEKKAAELEAVGPELQGALERLRESMRVLQVELAVLQEAQRRVMRVIRVRSLLVPRR